MRNNKKNKALRVIFTLIAAMLFCGMTAAPMTAYAYTDEGAETEIITPEPTQTPEPTPTPEPQPLTPDGNLTLVDDISGEQTSDKQFITVVTKSGNYFYLVIDRAGDRENVYFLNLVDEADLLAIIEGDKKQTVTPAPIEPSPEPSPTPEPTPEPEKSNTGGLLLMLLLIGALGGGAFYYFKVLKPKQGAAKSTATTELNEFDFDEDEDELSDEDTGERDYDSDNGDEMPDFTASPDSEPDSDGLNFDFGDLGAETPESEGKE